MRDFNVADRRADDFIERRQRDASDIGSIEYRTSTVGTSDNGDIITPFRFILFIGLGLFFILLLVSVA